MIANAVLQMAVFLAALDTVILPFSLVPFYAKSESASNMLHRLLLQQPCLVFQSTSILQQDTLGLVQHIYLVPQHRLREYPARKTKQK